MRDNRILVIGLDGASWNVLEPLMAAGKLPNLSRLVQEGASGILRSTIPPVTAPAWVSFSTGVNPGKHGVFTFETRTRDGHRGGFVSSRSVRGPRLWQWLSEVEKRVTIINLPVTYPVEPVNGFMISGMLTPGKDSEFTYPPSLRGEVLSIAPDYETDVNLLTGARTFTTVEERLNLIAEVRAAMKSRGTVAKHLIADYPWDFFMVVFVTMDRIQHVLWRYLDPGEESPPGLERIQPAIHDLYSDLDAIAGQLITEAGEDATVFIMSDHGFGPLYNAININRWLQQQGLLQFNETKGDLRRQLYRLSQVLQWRRFVPESLRSRLRSPFESEECINWAHTKAYSGSPIEQGIYINTANRREGGIVQTADEVAHIRQKVKNLLPQLRDPATGLPVIDAVYDASELFTGPFTSEAADLIYMPRDSAYLSNDGTPDFALFDRGEYSIEGGYHHPNGILVMQGPDVQQGTKVTNASIIDLAPTILYALDLALPEHLDGVVLQSAFQESFLATHPLRFSDTEESDWVDDSSASIYTESENEIIRSRLRDLGYID